MSSPTAEVTSSQPSSTCSISAMSAMVQPAFRSGRTTFWCGAGQDVRGLGHEVDAAEDDEVGLRAVGRELGQLEGVAGEVGVADDLVALVVVAQDDEPAVQLRLRGDDALLQLLGGRLPDRFGRGAWTTSNAPRLHHAMGARPGPILANDEVDLCWRSWSRWH